MFGYKHKNGIVFINLSKSEELYDSFFPNNCLAYCWDREILITILRGHLSPVDKLEDRLAFKMKSESNIH